MIVRDEREELINNICLYIQTISDESMDSVKNELYILANNFEITNRSTEIAEISEDRNKNLLERFLLAKKVAGCTKRTIKYYGTSIKKVLHDIGKTVDDITTDDIRFYIAVRERRDKVSKVTVGNETRNLSSFFTWLYEEELIRTNPMRRVERIKQAKTKKEAFTEMEIERLRMAADGDKEKMVIEVLWSTGCRVTELAQMLIGDIDADRILVHGKGEKDRYVYLNARAKLALEVYLGQRKDRNPYLLPRACSVSRMKKSCKKKDMKDWWKDPDNIEPGHTDPGTIESNTRDLAKRAGVGEANPHKFRRTCATMALRRGMPIEQVSKMLGHESIETTQIYLDLSEDELKQAHKKYVV